MPANPISSSRTSVARTLLTDCFNASSYVGNNTVDREITVGFTPDLVIIKGDTTEQGIFRTSVHADDRSSYLANAASNASGLIKTFTATGFTIGTTAGVNTNGITYHYIAIKKGAGILLDVGTYTGNGVDDRNITGLKFQPDFIYIKRDGASNGVFRDSLDVGDVSHQPTANSNPTDCIQALNSDGFQIGTNALVNTNANRYEYFALKQNLFFKVGTYTGNGSDNRNITGVGFTPDFVLTKRDGASSLVFRSSSMQGDTSGSFANSALFADGIQSLFSNGFQIGTSAGVNSNATVYHHISLMKGSKRPIVTGRTQI